MPGRLVDRELLVAGEPAGRRRIVLLEEELVLVLLLAFERLFAGASRGDLRIAADRMERRYPRGRRCVERARE